METLYFVDTQGNYLGGFQGANPLAGAIQVPNPPDTHADQKWTGTGWTVYVPPVSLGDTLSAAFMTLLPQHLGQPYLTGPVITTIMQAKVAVEDAFNVDPTGTLAKAIISSLGLPVQMQQGQQQLLSLFPQ